MFAWIKWHPFRSLLILVLGVYVSLYLVFDLTTGGHPFQREAPTVPASTTHCRIAGGTPGLTPEQLKAVKDITKDVCADLKNP